MSAWEHPDAIREAFAGLETANVSDVLDRLGFPHQALDPALRPVSPTGGTVAGWAYTIQGQHTPFDTAADPNKMAALDGVTPGTLTVWSGGGARGVCLFGELLARGMAARGALGAVVDGGVRDVRHIRSLGFAVWARYVTPVQSTGRWKVNAWQIPVYLPGATAPWVRVEPGDLVLADDDGVVVVPRSLVETVLEETRALTDTEAEIRARTDETAPSELMRRYGRI
ncbi:MAG: RraA family protein [Actinomycetia bacterium]|nr:RraA family protein [Actinomycetes bacterium]